MGHSLSCLFRKITFRKHTKRDCGAVSSPDVELDDMEPSYTCRAQRSLDKSLPPVSNDTVDVGDEPKAFEDEADRAQFIRAAMIVMSENGKYEILNSRIELMYTGRRDQWRASLAIVLTIDSFGRSIGSTSTERTRARAFYRLKLDVMAMLDIILYNRDPNRRRELKAAALRKLNAAPPKKAIEVHPPPPGFENLADEDAPWRHLGPKAVELKKTLGELNVRLDKMSGKPPEGNKRDQTGKLQPNSVQRRYLAKKGIFPREIDGLGDVWDYGLAEPKRKKEDPTLFQTNRSHYTPKIPVEDKDYCDPMDMEPTNIVEMIARWQYNTSMRDAEKTSRSSYFGPRMKKSRNTLARHKKLGQNVNIPRSTTPERAYMQTQPEGMAEQGRNAQQWEPSQHCQPAITTPQMGVQAQPTQIDNQRMPTPPPPERYRARRTQAKQHQGPTIRDGRIMPSQRQQPQHGPVEDPEEETLNQVGKRLAIQNAKARDSAVFAKAEKGMEQKAEKDEQHETGHEEQQTPLVRRQRFPGIQTQESAKFQAYVTDEDEEDHGLQQGSSSSSGTRAYGKPSSAPTLGKEIPLPPPRSQSTGISIQEPAKFQVFVTGSDGEDYPLDEDSPSTETRTLNRPASAPAVNRKSTSQQIRGQQSSIESQHPAKYQTSIVDSEGEEFASPAAYRLNESSSSAPKSSSPRFRREQAGPSLIPFTCHANSQPGSPQNAPVPCARSRMRGLQRTKSALKTAKSGKAATKSVSFSSVRVIQTPGEEPVEEQDHWDERDWQGDDDEDDDVEEEGYDVDESDVDDEGYELDDYRHAEETDDNPKRGNDKPHETQHEDNHHDADEFEDENDDVPLAMLYPPAKTVRMPGAWPRSPSSVSSF